MTPAPGSEIPPTVPTDPPNQTKVPICILVWLGAPTRTDRPKIKNPTCTSREAKQAGNFQK